ncbi:MAG: DNA repair protein RecN [Saprospiraceae bacterium]|nr:DNA repair protein RecN [Saprospiraceae bacterium]
MLQSLLIKNYAIIDQLEIEWQQGMTVITGETGAGKSIIIGALQLVLGNRSDVKALRNPDEKCIVEAIFSCTESLKNQIQSKFETDATNEVIVRREILPSGKSRSFINDSPVLLTEIQQIAHSLLSIHQQFDHLDFFDRGFQLEVLDSFAANLIAVQSFRKKFKQYQELIIQRNEIEARIKNGMNEKEFLEFQWNELDLANLKPDEINQLEQELKLVSKAEEIKTNSLQSFDILQGDRGILDQIQECMNLLKNIRMNNRIQLIFDRLEQAKTEIKDMGQELEDISEGSEFSPEKIKIINQRLDLLNRLTKKHRVQTDLELIVLRTTFAEKLESISTSDETLNSLNAEIERAKQNLTKEASSLSKIRKGKSKELIEKTNILLKKLGMEFAKFDIQFNSETILNESGSDQIEFLFCANKGATLRPIKEQASGGELARFNLAIKSLVAKQNESGCLIFDEIDTGVSGQIALQMGNILKEMAAHQQVICITHSPQVASRAKQHYYVYKEHKTDSTNTKIKSLTKEERLHELAKMLSGEPPTKAALKNASELILM